MKHVYFYLTLLCAFATSLSAQTGTGSVVVPSNLSMIGELPVTYISDYIDGDTLADGTQAHLRYILEDGGLYLFNSEKRWAFDVELVAETVTDPGTAGRPILSRFNAAASNLPPMYRGTGSLTFIGLDMIIGEEQPDAPNYENSSIRPQGVDKRFIFQNCMIEKSRQAIARIEGDGSKSYVENCWVRNMGDYKELQGNGRLIDVRTTAADSVVIRNNVIHNILDRLFIGFRMTSLNYFDFSSNTVFNHVGRHGLIQLKNTKESVINNNLFSNPKIIGTSPFLSDEQINFDDVVTFLFTLDTIIDGASLEMRNNNIYYNDDVLNHFESFDLVARPPVMSPTFIELLGDTSEAYFTEVLELNNVPSRDPIIQYSREAVMFPDSTGITDIMVEPIDRQGTPYDEGYLFDFSMFDPCYGDDTESATGATDGGRVGARTACGEEPVSNNLPFLNYNEELQLTAAPNPANTMTKLSYVLSAPGQVNVSIYDISGKLVGQIFSGHQPAGTHSVDYNRLGELAGGMYFVNLFTEEGRMMTRVVKQ